MIEGLQNSKQNNISLICKFPLTQNTNQFKLGFIFRGFEFVKRKLWLIGTLLLVSIPVYYYITYRLTLISWDRGGEVELQFIDILFPLIAFACIATVLVLLAKSFASPSSGKIQITRPTSDSVDGFGSARAYDYSYSPGSSVSLGITLPVSLSQERRRTETYGEWAKEEDEDFD